MKTLSFALSFLPIILLAQSPFIHVDQFGYTPNAIKIAVLSDPQIGYNSNLSYAPANTIELRNANNNTVVQNFSPIQWNGGNVDQNWSGDRGWWLNFSGITTPGSYYLHDPLANESSAIFDIGYNIYDEVQ